MAGGYRLTYLAGLGNCIVIFDRKNLNLLFRYCLALCGERENARDLLHDSIEKYLRNPPDVAQKPEAYIKRIARNHFIDRIRREQVVQTEVIEDTDVLASTERALEDMMVDQLTLEKVWQHLTPLEREVIYYWAVEEMSASEIALHTGQSRNTVLSRLHRLRLRMQAYDSAAKQGKMP